MTTSSTTTSVSTSSHTSALPSLIKATSFPSPSGDTLHCVIFALCRIVLLSRGSSYNFTFFVFLFICLISPYLTYYLSFSHSTCLYPMTLDSLSSSISHCLSSFLICEKFLRCDTLLASCSQWISIAEMPMHLKGRVYLICRF